MRQPATPIDKPTARRRTFLSVGLALILLAFAMALPAGASAFRCTPDAEPENPGLFGVAFSDSAHGWAVGQGGAILATTDGGATWKAQTSGSSSQWLTDVAFPDATHGWAVGNMYVGSEFILSTTDGGATWSKQYPEGYGLVNAVAFIDIAYGWALGQDTIFATTNGGYTWIESPSARSIFSYDLRDVAFSDAMHGWVVGRNVNNGPIFITKDGGRTWSVPMGPRPSVDLTSVAFPNSTHGWAVGDSGAILATTDGGTTWSAQNSGTTADLTAVAFSDAAHGWAVGGATIIATTNGGATWSEQYSAAESFNAVAFPDATHGWAVSWGGAIFATTDGGATWSKQYPKSAAPSIAKLKPASAKRGALVTITGADFGTAQGTSSVKFGSKTSATYLSWTTTQIKCKVPTKAKYGALTVTVTTAAGTSNAMGFTVKR